MCTDISWHCELPDCEFKWINLVAPFLFFTSPCDIETEWEESLVFIPERVDGYPEDYLNLDPFHFQSLVHLTRFSNVILIYRTNKIARCEIKWFKAAGQFSLCLPTEIFVSYTKKFLSDWWWIGWQNVIISDDKHRGTSKMSWIMIKRRKFV